ncbi:MAG TPA: hypothetical protein VGS13_07385 [Stellaceae bacterium]|nr:hypothetical protein [Stellaceae bacterium]
MSESGSIVSANDPAHSGTAKVVYVLYLIGWIIPGIVQIIGVILAYVNRDSSPAWLQTHYEMQIRTFWIGLLFGVISLLTTMIYIGWLLVVLTVIWWTIRCIKGLKLIFEGSPYDDPTTWLW